MDINDIKSTAGVVFNKQDSRFNVVVENHLLTNKKRILNRLKDEILLKYFNKEINKLSYRSFFVQINEKMYACGIENCSIEILFEDDSTIHCVLSASFHLYSNECGFYRVSDVQICQKKFHKEKDKLNRTIGFLDISDSTLLDLDFEYLYNNIFERIRWGEVYDNYNLNNLIFKFCQVKYVDKSLKYSIEILKNDTILGEIFNIKSKYMSFASPSFVGFIKQGGDHWEIYDFLEKRVKYSFPNKGYYKNQLEKYNNLNEYCFKDFVQKQNRNPMLEFSLPEIIELMENTKKHLKDENMYLNNEILKFDGEHFEFTFKSNFDKISNIAVIYASRFETFKRISVDTYYVSFESSHPEHIELMYFILRKMKYIFNQKTMDYVNKVSVLRMSENLKEAWQLLKGAIPTWPGTFMNCFSDNNYEEFCALYKSMYNKKIKRRRNDIYNEAIAKGFKLNKWSSEQKLYALIVRFYNDATYQYQDTWLGLQSLDVYIPSLKIAFEYQGEQHYTATDFFGGEEKFEIRQERDERKRNICLENGVTLIEWRYDEEITKENLAEKLKPIISELPEENLDYSWQDEKLKLAFAKEKKSLKPKVPTKVLVQYDIDGNYINHFISQEEASKKTGASKGTISFVINGRQKTSGGYVWRYFDVDKIPKKIKKTEITSPESKEVIQLDFDGNIIKTFPSINSASKICGISSKSIRKVINGKQKTAGGYKWKQKE